MHVQDLKHFTWNFTPSCILLFWLVLVFFLFVNFTEAQPLNLVPGTSTEFHFATVRTKDGQQQQVDVPALIYAPPSYESRDCWPLLLFLHGYGECGEGDFSKLRIHGPIKLSEARGDADFVVLAPQTSDPAKDVDAKVLTPEARMQMIVQAWEPEVLLQVVQQMARDARIDPRRIYVTGLSMGGYGTWRVCSTYPEWFAAAVPICGGGQPDQAAGLKEVPVWAFHGAKDLVVRLEESEAMVNAMREAGGDVKLTVYPEADHDSWTITYQNPEVFRWMASHRKAKLPPGATDRCEKPREEAAP